jgi:hypothetical protein
MVALAVAVLSLEAFALGARNAAKVLALGVVAIGAMSVAIHFATRVTLLVLARRYLRTRESWR